MASTLCWQCVKAYGGCSWSSNLEPVKGWEITKGQISCCVKSCPEFKKDPRCYSGRGGLTISKVCKIIGICERTYYRKTIEQIEVIITSKNLPIYYDRIKKVWIYK